MEDYKGILVLVNKKNKYMSFYIIVFVIPFLVSAFLGGYVIPRMKLVFTANNNFAVASSKSEGQHNFIEIGGLSIFPLMLISICVTLAIPHVLGDNSLLEHKMDQSIMRILQIIAGLSLMYVVGLKEDLHGTNTKNIFLGLLLVSAMFPATGLWINDLHGLFGVYEIPAWVGMPLTVLLAIYITEIFKLMDGIDGLESGISTIALCVFIMFCSWKGFVIGGVISSAALGLIAPYWVMKMLNRRSKKTILGNSGSYIMGYVIAYLTIGLTRQGGPGGVLPEYMLIICFSVIMLPALDLLRVLRSRVKDSRALLLADKNQINHKLIRTGMGRTKVIACLLFMTLFVVGLTTYLAYLELNLTYIFIIDMILYVVMHYVINYFIAKAKNKAFYRSWNKVYGEEAWNADIPEETLRVKKMTYGTMGLPAHIIEGNDITFIPDGMNAFERQSKRMFDLFVSGCCLVVFSPLFLLSYILIKLDDGGPAIYRQERIGRFGRPFYILKYRSMRLDAEKFGPALSHAGGEDDPRLTKVGKFIRAHHLDELPQLWNVFKGEMSLIGYRPERKFFIDQIMENDPRYAFLYQIRPGVTSYATLYNGYTDTMEKMLRRLELDLYYLGHRSWWLDMKVLMLTFLSIVGGKKF